MTGVRRVPLQDKGVLTRRCAGEAYMDSPRDVDFQQDPPASLIPRATLASRKGSQRTLPGR